MLRVVGVYRNESVLGVLLVAALSPSTLTSWQPKVSLARKCKISDTIQQNKLILLSHQRRIAHFFSSSKRAYHVEHHEQSPDMPFRTKRLQQFGGIRRRLPAPGLFGTYISCRCPFVASPAFSANPSWPFLHHSGHKRRLWAQSVQELCCEAWRRLPHSPCLLRIAAAAAGLGTREHETAQV